jgi:hypothetical protein
MERGGPPGHIRFEDLRSPLPLPRQKLLDKRSGLCLTGSTESIEEEEEEWKSEPSL